MSEGEPEVPTEPPSSAGTTQTAEIQANENLEEGTNEETAVIDVHAAHGGIHTWRDFWIHLGTIALGLLIAIGLEQSVEAVHRLHERHQLEADLRAEGLRNQKKAADDIVLNEKIVAWLLQLQRGVDEARDTGEKAPFVYPARPDGFLDSPRFATYRTLEAGAWATANGSSLLVLLPRGEAETYANVYSISDLVRESREQLRVLEMRQGAFETRFSHGTYPPEFELSRLTPQQLDDYEALLADELEGIRIESNRLRVFAAANDYVLSGNLNWDDLHKAVVQASTPQ